MPLAFAVVLFVAALASFTFAQLSHTTPEQNRMPTRLGVALVVAALKGSDQQNFLARGLTRAGQVLLKVGSIFDRVLYALGYALAVAGLG